MFKVSIIVPIFNKEKYLENCIESLKKQTYSNIEIILINDGSTDNSKVVLDSLAKADHRIELIHKTNEGVSIARNIGVSRATGDYLMFVDPDDSVSHLIVEKLLDCAIETNSDIVSSSTFVNYENINKQNSFFQNQGFVEKERAIAQLLSNDYYNDADEMINIGVPWGKLYKKELITNNNIEFPPGLRRSQDNIFNLYCFHHTNTIYYIDEPLYVYRYENYNTIFDGYVSDAEELYSEIAQQTYTFINKYYSKNNLLIELTRAKLLLLFIMLINKKVFHPEYKVNWQTRKRIIEKNVRMNRLNLYLRRTL